MTTQPFDFAASRRKEAEFDSLIDPVVKNIAKEMSLLSGGLKVWGSHFGATGIDPKHLFVYFVLPTRADVISLTEAGKFKIVRSSLLTKLEECGYPVAALQDDWLGVFSEQECKEEANGNWYYFFK
ncbi:hypothetical protein [Uliginosibacterium sp. TH139]|nr:hypothetical protein [Uliginosibacterium sp. TH139]